MSDIIAADSLNYKRWKRSNPFYGLIGSTVSVRNPEDFKVHYAQNMIALLNKFGLKADRISYCSSALAKKFFDELGAGYKEFASFLNSFVESMSEDVAVGVFYATCNTEKYPETVIFTGEYDSGRTETIPTIKFLRDWLSQYFDYVCAWKLTKCTKIYRKDFYLDGFRGPITHAWNELVKSNTISIFPLGDDCNAFVSFADLMARCVDEALRSKRLFLDKKKIEEALKDVNLKEVYVHYCFHNDLQDLVPLYKEDERMSKTGKQISVNDFRKRPIVFIIKEGSKLIKEDTEWLKQTPFYAAICNLAWELDASVSFYSKKQDNILDGDKIIFYGPKGQSMAKEIYELMKGVGRDIELIYSKDLMEKYVVKKLKV